MSDEDFNCKYKTSLKDYQVIGKGTKEERVLLVEGRYQDAYSEWSHLDNLRDDVIRDWRPCQYFHQLNIALTASHSILNYPIFLSLLPARKFRSREILILDEAHLLESEILKKHPAEIRVAIACFCCSLNTFKTESCCHACSTALCRQRPLRTSWQYFGAENFFYWNDR